MTESVIETKKISPATLKFVKETIETIYDLTQEEYHGCMKQYGKRFREIATVLIKRGSLLNTGNRRHPVYKWNPIAMKPTKVFFASVADELVTYERGIKARYNEKKKSTVSEPEIAADNVTETFFDGIADVLHDNPLPEMNDVPRLIESFTDEDLWEELKRRGYQVEDGELVKHIIKRLS